MEYLGFFKEHTKSWKVSAVNISATLATTSKLCLMNCCHSVSLYNNKLSVEGMKTIGKNKHTTIQNKGT